MPHVAVDREFVDVHYRGALKDAILRMLEDPHRVLLTSQTFTVIAKIAIQHCRIAGSLQEEQDPSPLARAALGVPQHLTEDVDDLADEALVIDTSRVPIASYLVANQLFNNPPNLQAA